MGRGSILPPKTGRHVYSGRPPTADIGPAVQHYWLRIAAIVLASAMGLPLWLDTPFVVLPLLVFAGAAFLPFPALPLISLVVLILSYGLQVPPGSPVLLLYTLGLHLLFALYGLLLSIPTNTQVSTAVLFRMLAAVGRIQLIAQPVAAVSLFVHNAGSSLLVVLCAAAALAAWSYWLISSYRKH